MSQGHSPATPLLFWLKLTALVTSPCRDARSVRPSCPSVTASVTSPCRDARSVRPLCQKLQCLALSTTDAQTERPYSSRPSASITSNRYIIRCRQNKTSPCRDARSVRPSPLKATASSWFDNGRSDRASLQQSSRCVRCSTATHHPLSTKQNVTL